MLKLQYQIAGIPPKHIDSRLSIPQNHKDAVKNLEA